MSPSRSHCRSRFRPNLEALEDRYCPAGGPLDPPALPPAQSPSAPTITLDATVESNNDVVLSGQVSAADPAGLTVTFTGQYEGSTVTNSDGTYSLTVQASGSGTVSATVTDTEDLTSSPAEVSITLNPAPEITLTVIPLDHRQVLLSGQVTDANPGGLTVQFAGQYSGSVVTDPDGSFTVTVEAAGLGDIQASVTNSGGLTSNVAEGSVTSETPVISDFYSVREVNNLFTFYGQVEDEWATDLVISFSGLNGLNGQTVTVGEDGTFHFTVELAPEDFGLALAQVTDWWGLLSDEVQTYVNAS